jgi:hypothetical protein
MGKHRETVHLGSVPAPKGRRPARSVVVTEGPPDLVQLEPTPASHSPRQPLLVSPPTLLQLVADQLQPQPFDLTDEDSDGIEADARELAAELGVVDHPMAGEDGSGPTSGPIPPARDVAPPGDGADHRG